MNDLKIIPLRVGTLERDKSVFTYLKNMGHQIPVPVVMWYIQGASKRILVDTGTPPPGEGTAIMHRQPYRQLDSEHPSVALAGIGVKPEEIEIVVNTHLHWDHCSNNHIFPNAVFFVQRDELRFAAAPIPSQANVYESWTSGMTPPFARTNNYYVVTGDYDVEPRIHLLFTPGHTPGCQSLLIETCKGPYIIAGDTIPLFGNIADGHWIPHGVHVDLEEYFDSLKRIMRLGAFILPGHDGEVFKHPIYP